MPAQLKRTEDTITGIQLAGKILQAYRRGRLGFRGGRRIPKNASKYWVIGYNDAKREEACRT